MVQFEKKTHTHENVTMFFWKKMLQCYIFCFNKRDIKPYRKQQFDGYHLIY